MHAQGFLHRDIKPANIIVRRDGVPVLVDFGAARQAMGGRTRTLTNVLTPQYAPIEQYALDGKQGAWSDIYSAAAVLYHAIAGQTPPDAAARVGKDPYRPLAEIASDRFDPAFLAAIDRGDGLRAGRPAAERRGVERAVRRLVAQGRGCADATPCLRRRRHAAAPGRGQPGKRRAPCRGRTAAALRKRVDLDHCRRDCRDCGGVVALSA